MSCGCGRSPDFCRGWHSLSEEEWQKELAEWQTHNEYDKPTVNKHTVEVTEVHHYTDKLFRFQTTKPNGYLFKAGEFVICLLYTSPSPRDRTRSRMPSSA